MYKAIRKSDGREVIILDARWQDQLGVLRSLDRRDGLVCPGCYEPVRVKAGQVYRWHFAHKHLRNCPFENESPELLAARAVLYNFLAGKYEQDHLTVEKKVDLDGLPRHIDCWVEKEGQKIAYWIFDRRMPPDERADLGYAFKQLGADVTWVFVADMLRMDDAHSNRIHLTTTERAFLTQTGYDLAWQTHFAQLGGSLHYLDAKPERLITYRNLNIHHAPQLYAGKQLVTHLSKLLVSPITGEFVHPGEHEKLKQRQAEIKVEEQKKDDRLRQATEFLSRFSGQPGVDVSTDGIHQTRQAEPTRDTSFRQPLRREGVCKFCGTITSDWIYFDRKTKKCICRDCKDKI